MEKYNHQQIESKWQKIWEESGAHTAVEDKKKDKFYSLDFFPYPSGEGLHVGHWRGYTLSDIIARYQKLKGKNILHPMGYDAFGLPAENAAIKNKSHPAVFTQKAIERFRTQLKQIGAMYDWDREINSSLPEYYKWTQWLFLQLYKEGLAYRKKALVNWCPSCQTVLANEQVKAGECERCGSTVTKKELTQWFFKITNYAERLLSNLDKLDWPERTKILQKNWIGRSEGALINFKVADTDLDIEVFTTRADTLYGATFMVLAPEHPIVQQITSPEQIDNVQKYIEKTLTESDINREKIDRTKTGVFTGAYAINPVNNTKIPIWVADYVLLNYGTGAIMAVPAHDERDYDFATKFKIPIIQVIAKGGKIDEKTLPYIGEGILVNSADSNNVNSEEAKKSIVKKLEKMNRGQADIRYRLRDWLISRQRYWGAPIPIIHCVNCGEVPVSENNLPVKLPENVEFKPTGESPLKSVKEFYETKCPKCGGAAHRDTDTMDTFVDSSWYYIRYTDSKNNSEIASKEKSKYWLPVDLYIGGIEHATMHLLYARFISMVLHDMKIVDYDADGEPFKKLFNIGLIYLHGAKMSKSKGNVINPDELVEKYGSDALRGYEMFVGPVDQDSEWQISGISGIYRFLDKVWQKIQNSNSKAQNQEIITSTINKVTEHLESFRINTAISALMELFNKVDGLTKDESQKVLIIMSPIFPHITEELWNVLGGKDSIFEQSWPAVDKIAKKTAKLVIQVNSKVRDIIECDIEANQSDVENLAKTEKVKKDIAGKNIIKVVYVPGKIVNFVVK